MLNFLSNIWSGIKELWDRFEAWVAGWVPGLKTKIVASLTWLGGVAALFAEYLKTVDLSYIVNAKTLAVSMIVLGSLTFWLKGISERVEVREQTE